MEIKRRRPPFLLWAFEKIHNKHNKQKLHIPTAAILHGIAAVFVSTEIFEIAVFPINYNGIFIVYFSGRSPPLSFLLELSITRKA